MSFEANVDIPPQIPFKIHLKVFASQLTIPLHWLCPSIAQLLESMIQFHCLFAL
jgi:hypothetical protein